MAASNKQVIIQLESSLAFNGLCRTNLCLWSTFISTAVRTKYGPREGAKQTSFWLSVWEQYLFVALQ